MKNFKIAPLPLAIAGAMTFLPVTHATTPTKPSKGDLSVYSPEIQNEPPTIMLVAEASTYMNYADVPLTHPLDAEIISPGGEDSGTNPSYKRYYYYASISGSPLNPNPLPGAKSYTRLTRLKDAIFYLMDTPDALPDNYKVGLARYSGGVTTLDNPKVNGDSLTSNIAIAAKTLGPVSDYELATDDKGNYIPVLDSSGQPQKKLIKGKEYPVYKIKYIKRGTQKSDGSYEECQTQANGELATSENKDNCLTVPSHRYKIKAYIADMCASDRLCTGEAPMASAYAETGAYMMGTKTSQLTYQKYASEEDRKEAEGELSPEQLTAFPYTRALRTKDGVWEFCPEDKRTQVLYTTTQGTRIRIECKEDDWVKVDETNLAPVNWAGGGLIAGLGANPTQEKLDALKASGLGKYNLLMRPVEKVIHGIVFTYDAPSPINGQMRQWKFRDDIFQNKNPVPDEVDSTGKVIKHNNPAGSPDGWKYLLDETLSPDAKLVPVLKYRIFRKKGTLGASQKWQYCPKPKAKLVNYIYSSYRLMCDEPDWEDINKDNVNDINNKYGTKFSWDCGLLGCNIGVNNPKGLHSKYIYDAILNPYNGWVYYFDTAFKSKDYPPLPPTLNVKFTTSGVRNSDPDTRINQQYQYKTPLANQCLADPSKPGELDGFAPKSIQTPPSAIFFFTAGWPQSAALVPLNEMNMSLTPAFKNTIDPVAGGITRDLCSTSGLDGITKIGSNPANNHWGCMGEYAKRLRNPSQNPSGASIKTGVFLFTSPSEELPELPSNGTANVIPTYDCDAPAISKRLSQQNACKLGSYGYGFGEGGFFQSKANPSSGPQDNPEKSYEELAKALRKMTENLDNDVTMTSTNLPITPKDTFQADTLLKYGYLPMIGLKSNANRDIQWKGNVRKYQQVAKGFVDKNGHSPFSNTAGTILRATSNDFWSNLSKGNTYTAKQQVGGAFENIPTPKIRTTDTPRRVYVSSVRPTPNSPRLEQITPVNIKNVKNVLTGETVDTRNTLQRLLLNYMGYTINQYDQSTTREQIIDTFANGREKVLGGVYHSLPIALTSEVTFEDKQFKPSKQYILFGAMDNAVHIVDNDTGEEYMSYFPKEALDSHKQYKAITPELKYKNKTEDEFPSFGVDGPWSSYVTYKTPDGSGNENKLEADKLYVFGGLRLGGKAYYGLNLTGIGTTNFGKSTRRPAPHSDQYKYGPTQLFTITPETQYKNQKVFNRLGYTWAKPVIAKIKWQGERKDVAILTGGYDLTYDKTDKKRVEEGITDKETKGNAIYIVDIETGNPLIVASNTAANTGIAGASNADNVLVKSFNHKESVIPVLNSHLKYSVVSTVKTLDRDADELVDNIYFTDLNGQIFRLDINNAASKGDGSNPSVRLVRIADLKDSNKPVAPRLYETPIVTIHQNTGGQRFAAISVASGDRTNPLESEDNPNRVYVVYDKDVGRVNFFGDEKLLQTKDINVASLVDKPSTTMNSNYTKDGWTYPLTKFNVVKRDSSSTAGKSTFSSEIVTYNDATKYPVKALGPMSAVANKLYIAAYNPEDGLSHKCLAEPQGSSEAYQFCLPYGVCQVGKSEVSEPQRIRIGKGPQAIMISSTPDNPNDRQLITQKETTATPGSNLRAEAVATGVKSPLNATAPTVPETFKFTAVLRPMGWYDMQLATPDTSTLPTPPSGSTP